MAADHVTVEIVRFADFTPQIEQIRRTVFIVEQGFPESLEWDDLEHDSWHCLARCNDQPAGTGRLQTDGKITRIAVLESWRKRGIASRILEQLLDTATQHGLSNLYLNAQVTAVSLYEKYGFIQHGKPFDEGGIEHIRMVRP